ncbi:hypothetical protein ABIB37_001182 [Agrococcus sp. UYP10]|uniref:Uncharacterized protein n=1 Tax=Agrococcus jenensis TaxID=46353 RepID=A0A3N2AQT6_9MICO|nr:hypothetical protein EDD26_0760 [Agrococcus jenensis]
MRATIPSSPEALDRIVAPRGGRDLPRSCSRVKKLIHMLDVIVVASALALFALLGLVVKAVERL